jgi:molybdate/tungstate transport system permease protein
MSDRATQVEARKRPFRPAGRGGRLAPGFGLLGALPILFIALPLLSTVLGAPASALWRSLRDVSVQESLWLTFYAGAVATALALLGGIPLAYVLARHRFPGRELVQGIVDVPVVIPHTAAGIALLMVFGRRGVLGRWLMPLGVRFTDSVPGIVVGMLFVSMPYLISAAREAFALIDPELELMALVEGATPWQAFRRVTLPLAARGLLAGAVMMWARGISEFGAVVILAYHPQIMPVLVFERFQGYGLDAALPAASILIMVSLGVFVLLRTWSARWRWEF